MPETHLLSSPNPLLSTAIATATAAATAAAKFPNYPPKPSHFPPNNNHESSNPKYPSLSYKKSALKTTPEPEIKDKNFPPPPLSFRAEEDQDSPSPDFHAKLLYLESLGIDLLQLLPSHPQLLAAPLEAFQSSTQFLLSAASLSLADLRRVALLCPEALTLSVPRRLAPVLAFLLREARVPPKQLPRVLARRPRILACQVSTLLRPTLYFLHSLGICHPHKHPNLFTSPVETKLLPRLEFVTAKLGLSRRRAAAMFRRFPQLFCYSVAGNLQPKFDYFVVEMGRDVRELADFPQYFSFSLEKRIMPRHRRCVEKGACFPLPVLLRPSDAEFESRLELCCETSMPRMRSPLSCTECDIDSFS